MKWWLEFKRVILIKNIEFALNLQFLRIYKWLCFRRLMGSFNALLSIKTGPKKNLIFFEKAQNKLFGQFQFLAGADLFGNRNSFSTFAVQFLKTMYAIVNIAGTQFKVAKDQYIYAPRLEGEAGSSVSFDQVLLVENGGKVEIGAPTVKGVKVSGKILEHVKGNKVIVFKKKRRKGYTVKNGHRQQFTKVQIESIG